MTHRQSLLIGSMPFENETAAMTYGLDVLGASLLSLPDGEIGEKSSQYPNGNRAAWVMTVINQCSADTEHWETVRKPVNAADGYPKDYDSVQRLTAKQSPAQMLPHLDFGYHRYFAQSFPEFKRLRAERGLNDLKFQVGVPTGLGITFSMMSPINALRYADVFNQRIALEVNEILKMARAEGEEVVIQIEVPGEVAFAYRLPDILMGFALWSIWGLVKRINAPASIGFHLCLGDLNNLALTQAKTLDKLVKFSNRIVDGWDSRLKLVYMHYPLAEAAEPPTLDASFYQPLKDIRLPANTRFVAGFVHEKRTTAELQQIRNQLEAIRAHPVDIACSCGLGRRPHLTAEMLIQHMGHLVTD